jgi:hypothetical protein
MNAMRTSVYCETNDVRVTHLSSSFVYLEVDGVPECKNTVFEYTQCTVHIKLI